jgi:hypothetical protein
MGAEIGIVGIEETHAAALQEASLDRPVGLKGAVPLEMVRCEGGPDAYGRCNLGARLDLVAAHLHHQPVGGALAAQAMLEHELGGRKPYVSTHRRDQSPFLEQVSHQVSDGGLAVGAGDRDPGNRSTGLPGGKQVALHRDPTAPQGLQRGMVPSDPRTHHHGSAGGKGLFAERGERDPEPHRESFLLHLLSAVPQLSRVGTVDQLHAAPLGMEQPGHTDA